MTEGTHEQADAGMSAPDTLAERLVRYRLTVVTTKDYGDGAAAGKIATGTLARIPDGSHWLKMPQVLEIGVPIGTRPGAVFNLTLAEDASDGE